MLFFKLWYIRIFIARTEILYRDAEQDEDLESLEHTVHSTKHIALAVNEELDLHTRLLVCCGSPCLFLKLFITSSSYSTIL